MAELNDRIVPLDELDDFEVAEGDPDVRGWEVKAADGKTIGTVDNLLVDTAAMKVRYLDVDLGGGLASSEDRHILIPIGYARLHEDDDEVLVDALRTADLSGIPAYTHESLTPEYEATVRRRFDTDFDGTAEVVTERDFYAHDLYDPDRFYASRRGNPLV